MRLFCHICNIAAFVTLAACSDDATPSADTTSATTTPTDASPDTTVDPNTCAQGLTADVTGTWAVVEQQTALVQVAPFGTLTQVSTSLYRATRSGDQLSFELCDWLTKDDAELFTTKMGDSVLANLDPFVRDLDIAARGDGTLGFEVAEGYTLRGLTMADPKTETMPTEASDERVYDQDEDTHPGISLLISGTVSGQLYSIQRHHAAMDGCFVSASKIVGLTDWATDQIILGSNPEQISQSKPVASTHPDADLSNFVMVKVGDGDDCAAIKAQRATLFPE